MDLSKMDPMARKMNMHTEAFTKALEDGDAENAKEHLVEVLKFAEYLHGDLSTSVEKSAEQDLLGLNEFAGNVPVIKYNERGTHFDTSQRDSVLPGVVIPARTTSQMSKQRKTFGGPKDE